MVGAFHAAVRQNEDHPQARARDNAEMNRRAAQAYAFATTGTITVWVAVRLAMIVGLIAFGLGAWLI